MVEHHDDDEGVADVGDLLSVNVDMDVDVDMNMDMDIVVVVVVVMVVVDPLWVGDADCSTVAVNKKREKRVVVVGWAIGQG